MSQGFYVMSVQLASQQVASLRDFTFYKSTLHPCSLYIASLRSNLKLQVCDSLQIIVWLQVASLLGIGRWAHFNVKLHFSDLWAKIGFPSYFCKETRIKRIIFHVSISFNPRDMTHITHTWMSKDKYIQI